MLRVATPPASRRGGSSRCRLAGRTLRSSGIREGARRCCHARKTNSSPGSDRARRWATRCGATGFRRCCRSEIAEPDGPPVRVRLLGEDLVAFRDSEGRIGLVDEFCPHRRASLFFGRNEECGLRCVYHGWKFDVAGACVDMLNEPAEHDFKHKVHITAYPTCRARRHRLGLSWARPRRCRRCRNSPGRRRRKPAATSPR